MRDYKYAVYIGRFQPFHNGHLEVVRNGLEIADNVIVVVGSIGAAPNIRNPWSFEEREMMINKVLRDEHELNDALARVKLVGVRDYYYNENAWISEVQSQTDPIIQGCESVALLGTYKDASSYYLKYFPQWEFVATSPQPTNASDIRETLFSNKINPDWEGKVPEEQRRNIVDRDVAKLPVPIPVKGAIQKYISTKDYANLCNEWMFVRDYKKSWGSAPFPPMFVTTDAVVVCSGHVLVVERKHNPGKGLFALPGGFVKENQKIQDSMLRELKEETRIKLDRPILESAIQDSHVFDHPQRSLRGRTITHGYYLKLKDGRLPEVKGDDDASNAFWMPLMDVAKNERKFFEDHVHIINYFVGA